MGHLVCALMSPETPSILFMVTIRGLWALKGLFAVPWGKSIISRKKREPCLSPHARGLMSCVSKILAGPAFWNVSFISENPGGTGTYYYETNQATRASAKEPAPHPRVVQRPPLVRRAAGLLRQHEALRTRVAEDRPAGRSRTYAENQRIQIYGRIFQVEKFENIWILIRDKLREIWNINI